MYEEIFSKLLKRPENSNKYDFGHVLVVGGSPGMVGAPLLAAEAALRTGAGLVTIASRVDVTDKLEERVEEIMTLALSADVAEAVPTLLNFLKDRKVTVVVIGPGLALDANSSALLESLLNGVEVPMIIDGGGLGVLSQDLNLLDTPTPKSVILTPHIGEFQRLINEPLPKQRAELGPIATKFAQEYKITLVLKGHPTYVANPNGSRYKNKSGNPGMATAGSGDVLSGIIAGMISQGVDTQEAAEAGVYLHGLAGDMAAEQKTEPGMIASDIIEAIPLALKSVE